MATEYKLSYTADEIDTRLGMISSLSEKKADKGVAESLVNTHNTAADAHADIRAKISELSSQIVDEIMIITQSTYSGMTQSDLASLYAKGVRMIAITDLTYTNLVLTSIDTDGSIYNGVGYKDDTRLSSNGGVSSYVQSGSVTTGFMPYTSLGIIRIKGAVWNNDDSSKHYYVNFYDADKTYLYGISASDMSDPSGAYALISVSYDEVTGVTTFDFTNTNPDTVIGSAPRNGVYFRINACGKGSGLIVTVNEEI